MKYSEYINSNTWKEKRLKRIQFDENKCRLCDCKNDLEVHHRPSSYKKIPKESIEKDLITLCVQCHDLITNRIREERFKSIVLPTCECSRQIKNMESGINGRMENKNIQTEIGMSNADAQWGFGKPNE